jgi:hypothetical protein
MHARVSTYQGTSDSIDRALAQEEVVPVVRGMDGNRGLIYLVDRESGKSLSITLWDTAEALKESEQAANRLRRESSEASGETIEGVDRFEVAWYEVAEA